MIASSNLEPLEDFQENFSPGLCLHPGYICFEIGARSGYTWKEVSLFQVVPRILLFWPSVLGLVSSFPYCVPILLQDNHLCLVGAFNLSL